MVRRSGEATPARSSAQALAGPSPSEAADAEAAFAAVTGAGGLVTSCRSVRLPEGFPPLFAEVATGPGEIMGRALRHAFSGTGLALDPESARRAAIAEALERYSASHPPPPGSLVREAFSRLGRPAIKPERFALLSAAQRAAIAPLACFDEDKVVDWCTAFSLTNQEEVLLPAALCYLTLAARPPNDYVPEVTTTGVACHLSARQAILSALCEAIERDALAVTWYNRLVPDALDPSGTPAGELAREVRGGCETKFFRLATDAPYPVVLCLASNRSGPPHSAVGLACRAGLEDACLRALCEALQVLAAGWGKQLPVPSPVRTFADHAALYAQPEPAAFLESLLSGGGGDGVEGRAAAPAAGDAPATADLDELVGALGAVGLEVWVVDLTSPDVAGAGFHVKRVIVPGLVDVCADVRYPRLGARRLYELPVRLGLREAPLLEEELNVWPVPLA